MKYIVAGPTIINDIIFADGSKSKGHIGGSIFCVEGIKVWSDECLYVSNVGEDFSEYYGEWMDTNNCSYSGLNYNLPFTQYTTLIYDNEGLHDEKSIYGEEIENKINELDVITAQQISNCCDSETKGIYIEASEKSEIWANLHYIRNKCNAKIMWELPTSATIDKSRKEKVLETIVKNVDIYSINLPEAMSLFGVENEEEAINKIVDLGIPCFFRVGKKGSYMICEGKSYFAPSILVGAIVDATGCGNASTAAALYGYCEGVEPLKIPIIANISAAYNLLQYGPYPNINSAVKAEAVRRLNDEFSKLN